MQNKNLPIAIRNKGNKTNNFIILLILTEKCEGLSIL